MADKYHINPATGRPGKCTATKQCKFGGDRNHFPSKEAAQKAIEKALKEYVVPQTVKKPSKAATERARDMVDSCGAPSKMACGSSGPAPPPSRPSRVSSPPPTSVSCSSQSFSC